MTDSRTPATTSTSDLAPGVATPDLAAPGPTAPASATPSRLAHFPVTFFAVVMGTAGLALAWMRATTVLGAPATVGIALFWVAGALYLAVLAGYAAKLVRHPAAVRAELHHPVRLAFVPTATIAALLLATAGQEVAPVLAGVLFWAGAVGQLALTLYVMTAWIGRPTFAVGHLNPAWFIPVVGLVVVPLAGVRYAPADLSWFFFSVGLLLWLAMLPMVLSRLFVHDQPVPDRLLPTLAVLIAPPAVAFLAWNRLQDGEPGTVGLMLYSAAAFFGLLFLAQVGRLRRLPFFLSWWAYSFPLAALSVATTVAAGARGGTGFAVAAWTLLVAVTGLVALLAVRTAGAMARREICVPE